MTDCPKFEGRQADYPVDPLFVKRWSPRSMSGEALTALDLFTVLEAARWAPSAYNQQPWRFLYVLPDSPLWGSYHATLVEKHRQWVSRAGALVLILAKRWSDHEGKISRTYSFDAGAACQNACLQATAMNLVSHVVQGFDQDALRRQLAIPEDFSIEFLLVLGKPGDRALLPPALQAREAPTPRRGLRDLAFEGRLPPVDEDQTKTIGEAGRRRANGGTTREPIDA